MSDFSRISDEMVDLVHAKFGGKGVLKTPESVREFLERIEPLLVGPHIRHVVGESTAEESNRDYMGGMVLRLMEVQHQMEQALDDLKPDAGAFTRTSKRASSRGDVHINQSVTGRVDGSVFMVGGINMGGGKR